MEVKPYINFSHFTLPEGELWLVEWTPIVR